MITQEDIDKHRDIFVQDSDWYESVEESFKERMLEKGITVSRIYFSGFWSQGDGACFEGGLADTATFLDAFYDKDDYPEIRRMLANGGFVNLNCYHRGHHYHEYSVVFTDTYDTWEDLHYPETDEFRTQILKALDAKLADEHTSFYESAIEIFRSSMRDLYRDLQDQYEYLTSDEIIEEWLEDQQECEEVA